MNIFKGIPVDGHYETIGAAVAALVHRARTQGLQESAWSLVELRPDDTDFAWLCDWMRHLNSGVAALCLEEGQWRTFAIDELTFSYTAGLGTLLLMSAVEVARREATLHSLWAAVCQGYFPETTRALLFLQGHPTRAYKDAIEQAARWLNLRHVFGIEGLQNWYDTLSLQFGFSEQGFMRRLPEWLIGQGQTRSIQELLAGAMRSESFCALWEALLHYRRNNWKEAQLRALLHSNPWVLPEWIDDLVRQARAKLYLRLESETVPSVQDEEVTEPFLSQPVLRWDRAHRPHFVSVLTNLAGLDGQEPSYQIVIAGQVCGHLERIPNGSYRAPSGEEIILPVMAPQLAASLIAPDGQVIQSLLLSLWDPAEDVLAFYASNGQRFDPWTKVLRPETALFLLLRDDLSLEPEVPSWYALKQQEVKLYYLAPGWVSQTRVLLEDQVLWQPYLALPGKRETTQTSISGIRVELSEPGRHLVLGDEVQLLITLPTDTSLAFVRIGGQPLAFEWLNASQVLTAPLALLPTLFSVAGEGKVRVLLGVKVGSTLTRLTKPLDLPITGAAVLTPQGWTVLRADDALDRDQVSMQPVKIFAVESDQQVLLEGDLWIGRLWKTPRTLAALSGFGGPLTLCEGAYNLLDDSQVQVLAREVVDHGTLLGIEVDAPDSPTRTLSLQLSLPIEADEHHHTISWWDQTGTFQMLVPECCEVQEQATWWLASLPPGLTKPMAVAIAYNGIRLGTWWSKDWSASLRRSLRQSPQTIAALLRWLHLPLLSHHSWGDVQRFAWTSPGETLAAWVGNSGLPDPLHWGEFEDGWLSTVRTLFWAWHPTPGSSTRLLSSLIPAGGAQSPQESLLSIAWKLLRVSPLLMGRIIDQWVQDVGLPQWGAKNVTGLLQHLIYNMAEAGSGQELLRKRAALVAHVATTMRVDPAFVEKALIQRAGELFQGQPISRLHQENLAVAMNVEPFRRLLGGTLLETIDHRIGGGEKDALATRRHRAVAVRQTTPG